MNCETARRMMETNDPALAEHLLACPSCAIAAVAPYYEATEGLDEKIRQLPDWRGKTLAKVREIIHKANPEIVEEWKWVKPT